MNEAEKKFRKDFITELVNRFGKERTSLFPVLQEFQKKFRYIDENSQQGIADALNIHPVEVNSVISFYSFLYDKPRGKHTVRLCKNIICKFHGNKELGDMLKEKLKVINNNKSAEDRIDIELVSCIGLCDRSPSMLIDERVYEKINPQKAAEILGGLS